MPRRPSNAAKPTAPHLLTAATVALLPTTGTQYRVRDSGPSAVPGFAVQVSKTGVKTFTFDYRLRGLRQMLRMTFGRFPIVPPHVARREAARARSIAIAGRDPAAERLAVAAERKAANAEARKAKRLEREAARAKSEHTVECLARDYIRERRARLTERTAGLYESIVRRYLTGDFGQRPLPDLTQSDVRELLRTVQSGQLPAGVTAKEGYTARTGGEGAARTLRRFLGSVWQYAHEERQIVDGPSPVPAAAKLGLTEMEKERFLSAANCARLFAVLDRAETVGLPPAPWRARERKTGEKAKHRPKVGVETPFRAKTSAVDAIRFCILTGWRRSEVLSLTWSMLRRDLGVVILPDTKTGESVRAISESAWQILERQPRKPKGDWLFPSPTDESKHLGSVDRLWDAVRYAAELPETRLHDLRHTAASLAINAGASLTEVQSMLGHLNSRTTNRYAKLIPATGLRAAEKLEATLRASQSKLNPEARS